MRHFIPRDRFTYRFSADVPPVLAVEPGDTVIAETWDASTGRIRTSDDLFTYMQVRDPLQVNPAAGPIYVRGTRPGDGLVVTIEQIRLTELGYVSARINMGLLPDFVKTPTATMVRVDGDELIFGDRLRLPARPMVGVIGTTPATGVIYTGSPGPLGGNLDINAIRSRARVHLPVQVEGALLAIGDVHASMGDGEVSGTGVEIPAEVTFTVDLEQGEVWPRVWIENDEQLVTTGYAPDLDAAAIQAVGDIVAMLHKRYALSPEEAYNLFSAFGDVRIGQCAGAGIAETVYAVFTLNSLTRP